MAQIAVQVGNSGRACAIASAALPRPSTAGTANRCVTGYENVMNTERRDGVRGRRGYIILSFSPPPPPVRRRKNATPCSRRIAPCCPRHRWLPRTSAACHARAAGHDRMEVPPPSGARGFLPARAAAAAARTGPRGAMYAVCQCCRLPPYLKEHGKRVATSVFMPAR